MTDGKKKVVLVGTGMVGMSFAYMAIAQGICNELVLIDIDKERAYGEALDLQHAVPFFHVNTKVSDGDYADCADADIVVIPAGFPQHPGESRLDLVAKNAKVIRSIVDPLMASGFQGIILVASNPVDVMTYVAWKQSGLPTNRVFGSGTLLDSGRLRYALGTRLGVAPTSIHSYIIGEHGDSSVPAYSVANIAGKRLSRFIEEQKISKEDLRNDYMYARDAAQAIIKRKRATYYGIGAALAKLVRAVLRNERVVMPVGAYLDGEYGQKDIYIGVPAVIGKRGVEDIIELELAEEEKKSFEQSATVLRETIKTVF